MLLVCLEFVLFVHCVMSSGSYCMFFRYADAVESILNRSLAFDFSVSVNLKQDGREAFCWSLRFGLKWSESVGGCHVTASSQAEH